ncbi:MULTISPECIES: ABC transporter permease [unclassified Streptomyces]|uniref:ABC transporter permease n=1 Tax=unclassified Streptomyces TaxID=2593676 RepID=UPI001660DFE3|nr:MULTISPECIES: ABC transporter permease [unclassified Streptomyces]MBD0706876.1 ABC transporter permease [Streptomyces sp. CBMA291]MBD0715012.1 ABC transporter permease [Streptomyces sp. CBMA370]
MSDALRGEWAKAWSGRAWIMLLSFAVYMSLLTSFGYASEGRDGITAGTTDISAVTDDVVRAWMMTFLLSSLFGAIAVSREYTSGSISRSVLLTGRRRLFVAKATVSAAVGALFGLVAIALAVASAWGLLGMYGLRPEWTTETTLIALGVFVCNVLAAPWGAFLGWIIRHQIGSVIAVMAMTLLVDPGLQRLVPGLSKYLLTIAMSAVYRDVNHDLLSPQAALLVIAGWLAAAGFAGYRLLRTRDIT